MSVEDSMYAARSFVQRYGDLFGFMNDAVAVLQLDGVVIVANDAMATLTGCSIEELQGMNVACFLSIDDFRKAVDRQEQQVRRVGAPQLLLDARVDEPVVIDGRVPGHASDEA